MQIPNELRNPPKGTEIKYLKLDELKPNTYYTCGLTGNRVFIHDIKRVSVMHKEAIEGIYYELGRYRIAEYFDYMLY